MKLILLQDIANIGRKYDVVTVAKGYALNYLIPNGKARHADEGAIKEIEAKKASDEQDMLKRQEDIMAKLDSLKGRSLSLVRKANEEGHLFAKVDKADIRQELQTALSLDLSDSDILIDRPIKKTGEFSVRVVIGDEERELSVSVVAE